MDSRVAQVIALMSDDLQRGFPLRKMAESVNLSPTHLCGLFKVEIGMPPARYLRQLRMNNARHLLATTFLSIKEVMIEVGFTDESHFVRDFKRLYGKTPTQYRREVLPAQPKGKLESARKIGQ